MKPVNLIKAIACIYLIAMCVACNDELITGNNVVVESEVRYDDGGVVYPLSQEYKNAMTRSMGDDLGTNWENMQEVVLANGTVISLPWREISSGAIPFDLAKDVKKEDGWTMLLHTLTEKASDINRYIILYNQRTGIMKVFYHSSSDRLNNTAKWNLTFEKAQKWLNMGMDVAIPINLGELESWASTNAVMGSSKGFFNGWNCFQIALAYDPDPLPYQYISIIGETENVINHSFFGDTYAYSEGTILTYASKDYKTPINLNVGTIFGGDAVDYITNNIANQTQTRSLSLDVIKKAAKVVGKLTGWLKSDSEPSVIESDIELTTRGNFSATGFSQMPSPYTSLGMPFDEEKVGKLGSWNLREQPTVYLNPFADYDPNIPLSSLNERTYRLRGITGYDYELVINPNLQSHIKKQWVEIDLVHYMASEDLVPEVPDCYTDFGSVGGRGNGFTRRLDANDYLVGSYGNGSDAIINFDITDLTVSLQSRYHMVIGYDADEVFVPNAAIYGIAKVNVNNVFMRMSLYTVTEFEGKEATTISSRTFIPKFEWDPNLYNQYKDVYPKWGVDVRNINAADTVETEIPVSGIYYTDEQHPQGILIEAY